MNFPPESPCIYRNTYRWYTFQFFAAQPHSLVLTPFTHVATSRGSNTVIKLDKPSLTGCRGFARTVMLATDSAI